MVSRRDKRAKNITVGSILMSEKTEEEHLLVKEIRERDQMFFVLANPLLLLLVDNKFCDEVGIA